VAKTVWIITRVRAVTDDADALTTSKIRKMLGSSLAYVENIWALKVWPVASAAGMFR
jgi:hypothetical protein